MKNKKTKSRGFVFTIDAMLALITVIAMFSVVAFGTVAARYTPDSYWEANAKAHDNAVTSFYTKVAGAANPSFSQAAGQGRCYLEYILNPDNGAGASPPQAAPAKNWFCVEIT